MGSGSQEEKECRQLNEKAHTRERPNEGGGGRPLTGATPGPLFQTKGRKEGHSKPT